MKVKSRKITHEELVTSYKPPRKSPPYPWFVFRTLVRLLSIGELRKTKFTYTKENMKKIPKGPCLFLMNHSSFIDLKIASKILFDDPPKLPDPDDAFMYIWVNRFWLLLSHIFTLMSSH